MTDRPAARRALRARPRRADLPDVGAHLRLQPGVRALPVEHRPARPARADDRRVQGRHRRAAADAGLLRQHRRRRADRAQRLLGAARLRDLARRRREVLHQRHQDRRRGGAAHRGQLLRRRPDLDRRRDRRGQRRGPRRRARTTPRSARCSTCTTPASAPKLSVVCTRHNIAPARRVQGDRRPLRRAAAADPAAPVRPRRRRLGRPAPDAGAAARALRLAGRARRGRPDRRLVLPPRGVRRVAARAEPLRRRPRRLPHRPGRRRLRLPVRHPRPVPRRQRPQRRRLREGLARDASCSSSCASRRAAAPAASCDQYDACRGGCMAAKFFTGLPLDGPDPECVKGYGELALSKVVPGAGAEAVARPLAQGRRARRPRARDPLGRAGPTSPATRTRSPA